MKQTFYLLSHDLVHFEFWPTWPFVTSVKCQDKCPSFIRPRCPLGQRQLHAVSWCSLNLHVNAAHHERCSSCLPGVDSVSNNALPLKWNHITDLNWQLFAKSTKIAINLKDLLAFTTNHFTQYRDKFFISADLLASYWDKNCALSSGNRIPPFWMDIQTSNFRVSVTTRNSNIVKCLHVLIFKH